MGNFNHQAGNQMIEPMAHYAAHADKTYMWLAESYKRNDDATEYTITLRKGIKWSDGTPYTANDPAWAMNTLATVEGLNRSGTYKEELAKAEAVDDYTLKVTLKQQDFRFFFKSLTFRFDLGDESVFVPKHIYETIPSDQLYAYQNFDVAKGLPLVTSAYGMSRSEATVSSQDLLPTWWAVETGLVPAYPDVEKVMNIPFTTDTLAAQQVLNNDIDLCLDIRPLVMGSVLAQTDHVITWSGKKPPFGYVDWWPISVYFCNQKPPWDNPKVHWAVAYAIDQQQIIDVGWGGAGLVANSPFPQYPALDKYMAGIKDITDKYNVLEYNLDKSAALMTEAGFTKNADGWWADKDGVVPDSDIYAGVPLFSDMAPVIAEQLRKAGFKSEHKAPQDVWAAKVDGRASMYLLGHGGGTIDPYDTFNLYRAKNIAKMGEQSWSNWARWAPPEAEAITDEMNVTSPDDAAKMTELFRKWMTIYYEQLPDCPVVQWFHRVPCNTTYWDNWPTAENPYMNTAPWHLTQEMMTIYLKAKQP
jgi:peptide/nickel transport system substrate-binding protein